MAQDRRSTGQLISTLCYLGVGLWLLGEAFLASLPQSIILALAGLASLAGAARHPLARLLERFR
ncbi:MAG: hypothetical protein AAFZ02_09495 [Pseudomonadota bacterium]